MATTLVNKTAIDDGSGGLTGALNTVIYSNGVVHLQSEEPFTNVTYQNANGTWTSSSKTDAFTASTVFASYILDSALPTTAQQTIPAPPLVINLTPLTNEVIIPGSLRFRMGDTTYIDRSGEIYRDIDPDTLAGTLAGTINYTTGSVTLNNYVVGGSGSALVIDQLLTQRGDWDIYKASFRTQGAPIKPSSFFVIANKQSDGSLFSDTADNNGILLTADIDGLVETDTGIANIKFGRWVVDDVTAQAQPWYGLTDSDGSGNVFEPESVIPSSVKYNAVAFSYLPLDANLLGIDPVRLPTDGRVPIYRPGDVVLIHESFLESLPAGLIVDQVVNLTGTGYQSIELYDANDLQVDSLLYTVDLATSTVTMANPLDLSAYVEPLVALKRYEDLKLVSDVQINGLISLTSPIVNNYNSANAQVSTALPGGDIVSRIYNVFDQQTWTNVWDDTLIGSQTSAQFNDITFPLLVSNNGAIKERWALVFTSSTTFDIVGETVGVIGTGSTATLTSPNNPETSTPYFQIPQAGWGAGWSTGNVLRFNTDASNIPIWFARTTLPGPEVTPTDKFTIQIRGDA